MAQSRFVDIKAEASLSRAFTRNLDEHPALVGDEEHVGDHIVGLSLGDTPDTRTR